MRRVLLLKIYFEFLISLLYIFKKSLQRYNEREVGISKTEYQSVIQLQGM